MCACLTFLTRSGASRRTRTAGPQPALFVPCGKLRTRRRLLVKSSFCPLRYDDENPLVFFVNSSGHVSVPSCPFFSLSFLSQSVSAGVSLPAWWNCRLHGFATGLYIFYRGFPFFRMLGSLVKQNRLESCLFFHVHALCWTLQKPNRIRPVIVEAF